VAERVNIRDRVRELRRVPARDILPSPSNPRVHSPEQRAVLRDLLKQIGMADVLLARENAEGKLVLIDGHLRRDIFRAGDEVPVIVLEEEANLVMLTLDSSAGMATWDPTKTEALCAAVPEIASEAIAGLLEAVAGAAASQALAGPPELADPDADKLMKEMGRLKEKWKPELGQLWQAGAQRLICGDSTDPAVLARLFGGAKPEMLITDPPYGVNYDAEWRNALKGKEPTSVGKVSNDDRVDWSPVFEASGARVAYVWHSALRTLETARALVAGSYQVRCQIIWVKPNFAMSRGHYHWQHEPCWYAVKKGATSAWCGDRTQSTIWQISAVSGFGHSQDEHDQATGHSTQKPIECMARPMRNHDLKRVFDPFAGVGTTLLAAHQLERIGYGSSSIRVTSPWPWSASRCWAWSRRSSARRGAMLMLQRGVEGDLFAPHPRIDDCEAAGCVEMGLPWEWVRHDDGSYERRPEPEIVIEPREDAL